MTGHAPANLPGRPVSRLWRCWLIIALLAGGRENLVAAEGESTAGSPPQVLRDFKSPASFYLIRDWSQVRFVDGLARLRGVKATGGMTSSKDYDLSPYSNLVPALILRTTPSNTAPQILLTLGDAEGRSATWFFSLPKPSPDLSPVLPNRDGTMAHPNWIEKYDGKLETNVGPLDLARIRSLKVQGDWNQGVLDLDLDSIVLVKAATNHPAGGGTGRPRAAKAENYEIGPSRSRARNQMGNPD